MRCCALLLLLFPVATSSLIKRNAINTAKFPGRLWDLEFTIPYKFADNFSDQRFREMGRGDFESIGARSYSRHSVPETNRINLERACLSAGKVIHEIFRGYKFFLCDARLPNATLKSVGNRAVVSLQANGAGQSFTLRFRSAMRKKNKGESAEILFASTSSVFSMSIVSLLVAVLVIA